jgi:hypothetical protein
MDLRVSDLQCVPYGMDHWQMADIRLAAFSGRGLVFSAVNPFVFVGPGTLRLHQLRYHFAGVAGTSSNEKTADLILRSLHALCSPWDGPSRLFLTVYFQEIEQRLSRDQALQAAAQALSGLYHWQDWLFSAPAILPRAHLFAPDFGPAKPVSESDFVQVAMALRIKGRFVAILTEASAPTPKAARQKRSRLEAQEIEVLQLDSSGGTAAVIRLIDRIVEVEGTAFWQADPIPQGPFAPTAFNI